MGKKESLSALEQWKQRKKQADNAIERKPENAPSILSHGQERLWLLEQLYPEQNLYTYAHQYDIEGALNIEVLRKSFKTLANRHEILSSIYEEGSKPIQKPNNNQIVSFETEDLEKESDLGVSKRVESFIKWPYDLSKDPILRVLCLKLNHNVYKVILTIHHIAGDAWSMNIINQEISTIYQSILAEKEIKLEDLPIQYEDFAFWQRSKKANSDDLKYWKKQLSGERYITKFPTEKQSEPFEGNTIVHHLDNNISTAIKSAARAHRVTPYTMLISIFHILLFRYTGSPDQLIGSPFSNREVADLEKIVGFFNETFVIRAPFKPTDTFQNAVSKMHQTVMDAMAHKSVTFDEVVKEVKPERSEGENPLFQTMFLYNEASSGLIIPGLDIQEEVLPTYISKFDLTLFVTPKNDELELRFEHKSAISEVFIQKLAQNFERLSAEILSNPERPINELSMEPSESLKMDGNTNVSYRSILDMIFSSQRKLDEDAVFYEGKSLTYRELDEWSDHIAAELSNQTDSGEFVGLYTQRSLEMIVGIIGILKAGCAYVPLDPNYPEGRLNHYVEETKVNVILSQPELTSFTSKAKVLQITKGTNTLSKKQNDLRKQIAYVIFTSGSTGKPKGVPITHENLIYSTQARFDYYSGPVSNFLLMSSFSFDSSAAGIFWTLASGGRLILPPERIEQDIPKLGELLRDQSITHTLLLPSLYQTILSLCDPDHIKSLKTVIIAGEAGNHSLVNDHFQKSHQADLYNEYGPTEATVWCLVKKVSEDSQLLPIGQATPFTHHRILDSHMNQTPFGMPGELYIGGLTLSEGYLNHPELTKERFIQDPFQPSQKLYKTGDLVRTLSNGDLLYLGRNDGQIKIRGHRVELSEIRQVIESQRGVNESVVKFDKANAKLYAFVEGVLVTEEDLAINLKNELPAYMIPSLQMVQSFPRLPNGKIDQSKLVPNKKQGTGFESPNNDTEEKLESIWKSILSIETISINDNFFEIGGDSILSIRFIAKAREAGFKLKPTDIFKYQTIRDLGRKLDDDQEEAWSTIVPMKPSGNRPPLFCLHSGGAYALFYQDFANHVPADQPIYAVQPKGIDGVEHHQKSIREMAELYLSEIRSIQPHGPYYLLGTCFSNAVGIEILHMLKVENEQIGAMYIVDSAPAYLSPPSPNNERKPVSRMLELVKEGKWDSIYKKFRNRWIRYQKRVNRSNQNEIERDLDDMISSLNDLYAKYSWRPIDVPITLIRSNEFAGRKNKQFHIDHWTILSKNQLEVLQVDGHHLTLFKEPEVQQLAKVISAHKASVTDQTHIA